MVPAATGQKLCERPRGPAPPPVRRELHPPVVWLGYSLCDGPIYGRARRHWDRPGPWTRTMRNATLRACTDLQNIGGAYAVQIPALQARVDGRNSDVVGDDDGVRRERGPLSWGRARTFRPSPLTASRR